MSSTTNVNCPLCGGALTIIDDDTVTVSPAAPMPAVEPAEASAETATETVAEEAAEEASEPTDPTTSA